MRRTYCDTRLPSRKTLHRVLRYFLTGLFALLLAGCRVELYTGLPQKEANEMYSLLLENGIVAGKKPGKEGQITLLVEEAHLSAAVELLRQRGYPRNRFKSLDEVFTGDNLISTPVEQAAKLSYVKSQELAQVLSDIDGVITARVLLTQPDVTQSAGPLPGQAIRAAVFIKYAGDVPVFRYQDQIRELVKNSIQGLAEENITLTLLPAVSAAPDIATPELRTLFNLQLTTASYSALLLYCAIAAGVFILSHVLHFFLLHHRPERKNAE